MIFDRQIFRTVSLIVGVVFLLVGLLAAPLLAQENSEPGAGEDQYVEESVECTNAEPVLTLQDDTDDETPFFDIDGQSFRVTVETTPTQDDQSGFTSVDVVDENFSRVRSEEFDSGEDGSFLANSGPGRYKLFVTTDLQSYEIIVEDCGGGDDSGTDDNDDDNNGDNDADDDVIDDSVPDKDLPETGGLPLLGVAFFVLAGAGLLTAVVRRRR